MFLLHNLSDDRMPVVVQTFVLFCGNLINMCSKDIVNYILVFTKLYKQLSKFLTIILNTVDN